MKLPLAELLVMNRRPIGAIAIVSALAFATAAMANRPASAQTGSAQAVEGMTYGMERIAPYEFNGDVRDLAKLSAPPAAPAVYLPLREGPPNTKVAPAGVSAAASINVPSAPMPAPIQNFAGLSHDDACTGGQCGAGWPPDINGDVGPNDYIEAVNSAFAIYSKTGTQLAAFTENQLWSGGGSNPCNGNSRGDPVVLYDQLADRWILTNFAFGFSGGNETSPFYECIAVSKTSDPVSGGWWLYPLQMDPGGAGQPPVGTLNDYDKFGIWNDGCLYMAANEYPMPAGTFAGTIFASFSRADLESGASVTWSLGFINDSNDPFTMIPSNLSGTPPGQLPPMGTPNYFVSESKTAYYFEVREFTPGPNCGGGGTLSAPTNVSQAGYTAPNGHVVPEPNTADLLDTLYDHLMQKVQYRKIGGAESLWVVHNVQNADGTVSPQWAQIDVTGGTIAATPVQQEIYEPDTTLYRWMGSIAADQDGDVALGYSTSNGTAPNYPSIAYSGRLASDPLNQLPQSETQLIAGGGSQTNWCGSYALCPRWGDYTAMSVDPVDDCTFWYTNEYYDNQTDGDNGNWHTRIGSFKFPSCNAATPTPTATATPTLTPIITPTLTPTITPTGVVTPTLTATMTPTLTPTPTGPAPTPTATPTYTPAPNIFIATGAMTAARENFTATTFTGGPEQGDVLIAGGDEDGYTVVATAELYHPASGTFTATAGTMTSARRYHTATLLPNGKVLITGGADNSGNVLSSAELYDPSSGTFSATGSMTSLRENHTATLLQNGAVLIAGGQDNSGHALSGAELYDPSTGDFTATGAMASARKYHTATLLDDGRVLIAGGEDTSGTRLSSAELYNPAGGLFSPAAGSMTDAREYHTATRLLDGRVLLAGGVDNTSFVVSSAETFDPTTNTFTAVSAAMTDSRAAHTATLLNCGQVLIAGGEDQSTLNSVKSAEIFDPAAGTFTATGNMSNARMDYGASRLLNGEVLVAGGWDSGLPPYGGVSNTADLFEGCTQSPSPTPTATLGPTPTGLPPTPTLTRTATLTPTLSPTRTPTSTPTSLPPTPTLTRTATVTPALTPTITSTLTPTATATATAGMLMVSIGNGLVQQWNTSTNPPTFVKLLDTATGSQETAGSAFDAEGDFFVTDFDASQVTKFDPAGALIGSFGSGYNSDPESILFDRAGNVYIGEADGTGQILKFDPAGTPLAAFSPVPENRGADWIDLEADQCTMLYTSEGASVMSFNVCTNSQNPDFADGLPGCSAYALRIRSNGEVLVADSTEVTRLDASGSQIQHYTNFSGLSCGSPSSELMALTLDPGGTSFWVANNTADAGTVYKVDINSGTILTQFNATSGGGTVNDIAGLSIRGGSLPIATPTATTTPTLTPTLTPTITATATMTATPAPTPTTVDVFLKVRPLRVKFPKTFVRYSSRVRTITLKNPSKFLPVTFASPMAETTGDFFFASPATDCPAALPPRGTCHLYLQFVPSITGPESGTLTIYDNAINAPQQVSLFGTGK